MTKIARPFEVFKGKIRRQIILFKNKKTYINLLSVYDMLLCEKISQTLTLKLINQGFDKDHATTVAENASLSAMCLTDYNSNPIFDNTSDLLNSLTPEDMLCVVKEYNLLRKDYLGFDSLNEVEFDCLKKN